MRTLAGVIILLLLGASVATGQRRTDLPVRVGGPVRIQPVAGARMEGTLVQLDRDSITWRGDDGERRTLSLGAIDSLWAGHRHTGVGALVGTLVGVTPILLLCGFEYDECGIVPRGILMVVAGTSIGAGIGGVMRWKPVYP